MTEREGASAVERLQVEIASHRKAIHNLEEELRDLTGWGIPSFRTGTAAAIIMERLGKYQEVSIEGLANAGMKSSTAHSALQKLLKLGYLERAGIGAYRKKSTILS